MRAHLIKPPREALFLSGDIVQLPNTIKLLKLGRNKYSQKIIKKPKVFLSRADSICIRGNLSRKELVMALDIGGVSNQVLQRTTNKAAQNTVARSDDSAKSEKTSKTKDIHVSSSVQQAQTVATESTGIDTAKVDRIRAMIADGSYQVNAESVADKLIKSETSLFF